MQFDILCVIETGQQFLRHEGMHRCREYQNHTKMYSCISDALFKFVICRSSMFLNLISRNIKNVTTRHTFVAKFTNCVQILPKSKFHFLFLQIIEVSNKYHTSGALYMHCAARECVLCSRVVRSHVYAPHDSG